MAGDWRERGAKDFLEVRFGGELLGGRLILLDRAVLLSHTDFEDSPISLTMKYSPGGGGFTLHRNHHYSGRAKVEAVIRAFL